MYNIQICHACRENTKNNNTPEQSNSLVPAIGAVLSMIGYVLQFLNWILPGGIFGAILFVVFIAFILNWTHIYLILPLISLYNHSVDHFRQLSTTIGHIKNFTSLNKVAEILQNVTNAADDYVYTRPL